MKNKIELTEPQLRMILEKVIDKRHGISLKDFCRLRENGVPMGSDDLFHLIDRLP